MSEDADELSGVEGHPFLFHLWALTIPSSSRNGAGIGYGLRRLPSGGWLIRWVPYLLMSLPSDLPAPWEQYESLQYFFSLTTGSLSETLRISPPYLCFPCNQRTQELQSLIMLSFVVIRHIFCRLSAVFLPLLSVCLGFTDTWQSPRLLYWLAAGCLDSWPQTRRWKPYLLCVGVLALLCSRIFKRCQLRTIPKIRQRIKELTK